MITRPGWVTSSAPNGSNLDGARARAPEMHDPGRVVTAEDIAAVQRQFGCILPEPYVRFLSRANGGRPKPRA